MNAVGSNVWSGDNLNARNSHQPYSAARLASSSFSPRLEKAFAISGSDALTTSSSIISVVALTDGQSFWISTAVGLSAGEAIAMVAPIPPVGRPPDSAELSTLDSWREFSLGSLFRLLDSGRAGIDAGLAFS